VPAPIWAAAESAKAAVEAAKKELGAVDFEWYPYDSFSNVTTLRPLLASKEDLITEAALREGVLDLGCQDGELSFLFGSMGANVTAIDHPTTNHNGMRGVYALHRKLGSNVDVHEIDIDTQFVLPRERYGVALFLGSLYHLKNPYYALEQTAKRCRYCILSTRVTRCFSNGKVMPREESIAYFLAADELNHDDSNYWIFSTPALHKITRRAFWGTLNELHTGDTKKSRPTTQDHDERIYMLLASHYALAHVELLEGWWKVEETGWRWTRRRFAARLRCGTRPAKLVLRTYVPPFLIEKFGSIKVSTTVEGVELPSAVLDQPGYHTITRKIPAGDEQRLISFLLGHAFREEGGDNRELGIIVNGLEVE